MDYTLIENAEAQAWLDLFSAQTESYRQQYGFKLREIGNVWMSSSTAIPFPHFNCPLGLGIGKAFTEKDLDDMLNAFKEEHISKFYIHLSPATEPKTARHWLMTRGLRQVSSWHRMVRGNIPLPTASGSAISINTAELGNFDGLTVEDVTFENAKEWANFIDVVYHMPTGQWLLELVNREGWYHAICREGGKIVAARTLRINHDGSSYMMIDAPVPGVMTQRFDPDFMVSQRLVEVGLAHGVTLFTTDIEKPSVNHDTPAYHFWAALGFEVAFEKQNFML